MTVGEKIRYYRNLRGLSVADLAARLGAAPELVGQWETDQLTPTPEECNRLCGVLGMPMSVLSGAGATGFTPPPPPSYGYASPLYAPPPAPISPKERAWRSVALALFVCSIMSIFLGVIVGDAVALTGSEMAVLVTQLLIALIPVSSVVVGIVMNAKGIPNVKNIVAGVLAACFLISFATMAYTEEAEESTVPPEELHAVEEQLGIDLPEPHSLYRYDYGEEGAVWVAEFSGTGAQELAALVTADSRFLSECPTALVGMMPEGTAGWYDGYLLYRVDNGSFNTLPAVRGNYACVGVCYDAAQNTLWIHRYTATYIPFD